MKDFRLFDISDFVMDEDFIRWVHEKKNPDTNFWNTWQNKNPDKHMAIAEARRILECIGTEQRVINEVEKQNEIKRLMRTITDHSEESKPKARIITVSKKWWYAAATLVLGIAGSATYFLVKKDAPSEKFAYAAITIIKCMVKN